jgi:hypothetical protein
VREREGITGQKTNGKKKGKKGGKEREGERESKGNDGAGGGRLIGSKKPFPEKEKGKRERKVQKNTPPPTNPSQAFFFFVQPKPTIVIARTRSCVRHIYIITLSTLVLRGRQSIS